MRHDSRLPNWAVGLIAVALIAIASLLAFTKKLPFGDDYEVKAVFSSAQNVRVKSPVRIAGVQVGEVTSVEHLTGKAPELSAAADGVPGGEQSSGQQAAVVTMKINEEGRPLKEDATFKLRPRLFLEGNLFVDTHPGSPQAPEVDEGHVYGPDQTAYSVQLDQVLTTLQADVRRDLQTFLDQFGNALIKHGGAEGFRELFRSSADAFKFTSQVNEALLGTEPHDLSGLIKDLDSTVRALGQNETALQNLVTNARIFTGAFAAEDEALEQAIANLPGALDAARPAFANLNRAFPPMRAFAREALPGVRSTVPALDAATPFINQVRKLVSRRELRGLVADLRPTIPDLARLTRRTLPFLEQSRALASCFNEVIIPWSNDTVEPEDPQYTLPIGGRVFEETARALGGTGSESRGGDANGQTQKVMGGGGFQTVVIPAGENTQGADLVGSTTFPLLGAMPAIRDSAKTPFEPGEPCEEQEQPDLSAGGISGAEFPFRQQAVAPGLGGLPQANRDALSQLSDLVPSLRELAQAQENGEKAQARRLERRLGRDYTDIADGLTPGGGN